MENEINVFITLEHDNIIKFHESFVEKKFTIIVMEHANHGSLDEEINQRKFFEKYFQEDEIMNILI
jgi:serine/threonine protein kinase